MMKEINSHVEGGGGGGEAAKKNNVSNIQQANHCCIWKMSIYTKKRFCINVSPPKTDKKVVAFFFLIRSICTTSNYFDWFSSICACFVLRSWRICALHLLFRLASYKATKLLRLHAELQIR